MNPQQTKVSQSEDKKVIATPAKAVQAEAKKPSAGSAPTPPTAENKTPTEPETSSKKGMMEKAKNWIGFGTKEEEESADITPADLIMTAKDWIDEPEAPEPKDQSRVVMAATLFKVAVEYITGDWYKKLRPTNEFINKFRFEKPTLNAWTTKVHRNVDHFLSNYLLMSVVVLLLSILFTGFALALAVFLSVTLGTAIYLLGRKSGGFVWRGKNVPLVLQISVLTFVTGSLCVQYGLLSAIYWAFISSLTLGLIHASFHSAHTQAQPSTNSTNPGTTAATPSAATQKKD